MPYIKKAELERLLENDAKYQKLLKGKKKAADAMNQKYTPEMRRAAWEKRKKSG
jgi:hypothetical protein